MNSKRYWAKIGQSVHLLGKNFLEDDCFTHSAAIAYYTTFSLAPILLIVVLVSGLVFGQEAIQGEIYRKTADLIGQETAKLIELIVKSVYINRSSPWALGVSIFTVILGATTVFSAVHNALNQIWNYRQKNEMGFLLWLQKRLIGLVITLCIGLLIVALLIVEQTLTVVYERFSQHLPEQLQWMVALANYGLIFVALLILFWLVYHWLPDVKLPAMYTFSSAMFTTIFFALGRWLIRIYISYSSFNLIYGTAASLAVLLVWVYYSAIIFLLGAEFTKVLISLVSKGKRAKIFENI
ncbi:MAG: YihY/virulence factor BrkB family protein [Cytophagales bacterium]|nr:YihY/virulence factor BrkB family protein [Bernardetiaceae bacterium]MDW8210995.1 YihY/virulence factor BrkB family protein [Cytophagales bacterium]